jgi:hypothetical protein
VRRSGTARHSGPPGCGGSGSGGAGGPEPEVEQRSLDVYDALAGGDGGAA